jgi:hypothetical protein
VPEVNNTNCFNSTTPDQEIGFNFVYTTAEDSFGQRTLAVNVWLAVVVPALVGLASWVTWF